MKLQDINKEDDLRHWVKDHLSYCEGRVTIDWIEPAMFGSSVGQPDVQFKSEDTKIGIELKYLLRTKKGIKWTLRPAQRRYHHMTAKAGGKSAILAYIPASNKLILCRGDHVPLRDYARDPDSGCVNGEALFLEINYFSVDPNKNAMLVLEKVLFHSTFWEKKQ